MCHTGLEAWPIFVSSLNKSKYCENLFSNNDRYFRWIVKMVVWKLSNEFHRFRFATSSRFYNCRTDVGLFKGPSITKPVYLVATSSDRHIVAYKREWNGHLFKPFQFIWLFSKSGGLFNFAPCHWTKRGCQSFDL